MTYTNKNNTLAFKIFIALAMFFAAININTARAEASQDPAFVFIQQLSETALMSLTKKDVSRSEREKRVREILKENFDIDIIGRFALGTHWRNANENQKKEYLTLFEDMIVQTYTTRFEDYSGQKIEIKNAINSGKKDTLVSSQIIQPDGPPLNLEWRVRNKKGQMKVIDVVVEGISMSVTQRSDFSSVIQSHGGDLNALIDILRERKNEAAKSKS